MPHLTPLTNFAFSQTPSDDEISHCHVFALPLFPTGQTTLEEDQALAKALTEFRNRTGSDNATALTDFLNEYPDSSWKSALLLNLGIFYRHTGWFTRALDAWEQSWALAKDSKDPNVKAIGDTAVAELLELNARLGRYDRLETLFADINGRHMNPGLLPMIDGARQGLWLMQNRPEKAFRCGPMALAQIGPPAGTPVGVFDEKINESRSTLQGISLSNVCQLANSLGMDYQMAWRAPGSAVILPAVIHWKAGHYAALVEKDGANYLIKDPTFGDEIWISQAALDGESSGYCVVPAGKLPVGWRTVDAKEGQTIFGKGDTGQSDKSHTKPTDPKVPPCNGQGQSPMARYAVSAMLVSLNIVDAPVGYTPPRGQDMHFQITYNQKESYPSGATPTVLPYSNFGQQWTFNWMAYIVDDPSYPTNAAYYFVQGGGYETYTNFNAVSQSYGINPDSDAVLTRTSTTSYERDLPDGSKQIFSQSDGSASYPRRIFLTQAIDPAGNAQTFYYNSIGGGEFQLVAVKDAIGQVTTITNENSLKPLLITKVTDPFGRSATFQYDSNYYLTNITDIISNSSSFTYDASGVPVTLTTPYGTSTFSYGAIGLTNWLVATDPAGGRERVEYDDAVNPNYITDFGQKAPSTIVSTNPAPNYLYYRNTFYWDKEAMSLYPGDYTKATIYHWLHTSDINTCSGILESTKKAQESRIWNTYPGQPVDNTYQIGTNSNPATVAQVLDDGTSQIYQYQYNMIGKLTMTVDPANRTNLLTYSTNNVDLLTVAQIVSGATNILASYSYNSQHLPLTAVDAAGQTTYFGYNTNGQLIATTNALNEIALMNYNTNGYLTNFIAGTTTQLLRTNAFTYDAYGRLQATTDPLGYTLTYSYDAANRLTNTTYTDSTYQQTVYDRLDPVLQRDRNGHWTAMAYDPVQRLTDTYDNAGRHTHFDWCGCGSLSDIIDPNGHTTSFNRDLEGRVISKIYPDLTEINYLYETNTSRLKLMTDARNQSTIYSYFIDDNLNQVVYSNAVTPTVSYTYDTNFNRVTTMTDGAGTTTYNYYPVASGQLGAGQLSSVSNSFIGPTSVISYNYDALGRVTNRAINSVSQNVAFDMLNRVSMVTNVLGSFTNVYVGGTGLIATNFYPNGQQTVFSYFSVTNDERLQQIQNLTPSGQNLSKFSYVYDSVGNITNWMQQADAAVPTVRAMQYDPVNQLLNSTTFSNTVAGAILKQYAYAYDLAGNRTSEQIVTTNAQVAVSQSSYNNVNQVTNRIATGGPALFAGTISRPGTVTVNSVPATMSAFATNFSGYAGVNVGTNVVAVAATDYGNHSRTNNFQVVVTNNGVAETFQYDLNGNLTNLVTATSTNSYQWDAANRLVTIIQISTNVQTSLFAYDGVGRRIQDIEKTNGTAYVTNKFIWDGQALTEQRDSTGSNVTRRFFGEGELISGVSYYFTRDHLGSVREMTDSSGTIQGRYDYDPYGRQTVVAGTMSADFGYAGMFVHWPSGLNLTLHRAYDPSSGRWLSKDPIGENGGLNLYGYVGNNPINFYDPFGLTGFWGALGQNFNPFNSQGTFYQEANSIGQSLGGSLAWAYDEATGNSDLAQNDLNTVADAYNNGPLGQTQCNSTAHALVKGSLAISAAAALAAGAIIGLQAMAYSSETAAIARLGPAVRAVTQAQAQWSSALADLNAMADAVGADTIEWQAAMNVARITAEQLAEAQVNLLRAQFIYQRAAAATASFLGF